jgi:hypothetical protein
MCYYYLPIDKETEEKDVSEDDAEADNFAGHFMEQLLNRAAGDLILSFKTLLQHWVALFGIKKSHITSLLRLLKHYRPEVDFDSLPATGQQLMQVDGNDYNNYGFEIPFTPEDYDTSGKQLKSQFRDEMK